MKVQDYAQMIGYLTRDKTTDVPGSMAHGLRTGLYDGGRSGFDNSERIGFDKGGDVEKRTKIITNAVNKYNKLLNDVLVKYAHDHIGEALLPNRKNKKIGISSGSLTTLLKSLFNINYIYVYHLPFTKPKFLLVKYTAPN